MANIDTYLAQIMAATYGEEVRSSIHDSIQTINEEATAAKEFAEGQKDSAKYYAELAAAWSEHPPYIGNNGNWFVYDISTKQFKDSGIDADRSLTIEDITMLGENETPVVTNSGTNTDPIYHLFIPRGHTGNGIVKIEKTGTLVLEDTYTITYKDGNTETFKVTNGKGIAAFEKKSKDGVHTTYRFTYNNGEYEEFTVDDGNGIASVEKTGVNNLKDIYTISFTNGETSEFQINNARSIASIEKGGSEGLIDTYFIHYNDGSVSSFAVTNGADGEGSVSSVNNVTPVGGNIELTPEDIGAIPSDISGDRGNVLGFVEQNSVGEMNVITSPERLSSYYDQRSLIRANVVERLTRTWGLIRTIQASNWNGDTYTRFNEEFPYKRYNISLYFDTEHGTEEQKRAFNEAGFVPISSSNVLKCTKTVPTVDIPVILKVEQISSVSLDSDLDPDLIVPGT